MNKVKNMTSRERAINAMNGLSVDRVPVCFYRRWDDQDNDNSVGNYVDWAKKTGIDMLVIQNDGFMGFPMRITTKDIYNIKEARTLAKNHWWIEDQVDRARRISDALKGDIATFYLFDTPFSVLRQTYRWSFSPCPYSDFLSEDNIMKSWKKNWPILYDAMKCVEEAQFTIMDRLKAETAIDGMLLSFQNADKDRFTVDEYIKYLKEWDKRTIDKANSLYENNICHFCCLDQMPNNLELWKDYDYKTVNWGVHIEDITLGAGRQYFKEGSTVMGGFEHRSQSILYSGTEEEIKDYTKGLIKDAGSSRLIISADCSVREDISDEAIKWVVEACEEYPQK